MCFNRWRYFHVITSVALSSELCYINNVKHTFRHVLSNAWRHCRMHDANVYIIYIQHNSLICQLFYSKIIAFALFQNCKTVNLFTTITDFSFMISKTISELIDSCWFWAIAINMSLTLKPWFQWTCFNFDFSSIDFMSNKWRIVHKQEI